MRVRDYTEHPDLAHFVLEESWVLRIQALPGTLEIDIDLTYAASHPELRPPRSGEAHYGRVGVVHFAGVRSLTWTKQGVKAAVGPDGQIDWGAIDAFLWEDGIFHLEGDFGVIDLECAALTVEVTGRA